MSKQDFAGDKIPFTQVANEILVNTSISMKAKGLYAYLASKPDGWQFAAERIALETLETKKAIQSGLRELEEAGILHRDKQPTGRILYTLKHTLKKPKTLNGTEPLRQGDIKGPISNTNKIIISKEHNNTKDTLAQPSADANTSQAVDSQSKAIVQIIDAFKEVNFAYQKWYGNKTQRQACLNLIDKHGIETVLKVIKLLSTTNKTPYMTTITTPQQLEDRWATLAAQYTKEKGKLQANKVKIII